MQPSAPQALKTLSGLESYAIPRSEALARLRLRLGEKRREIRKKFEKGVLGGIDTARALADLTDEILSGLATYAGLPSGRQAYADLKTDIAPPLSKDDVPSGDGDALADEPFCLCATGGYGAGLLAPFSDLDLLFLTGDHPSPTLLKKIEYVLYTLWDLGLKVGHATRSIGACLKAAANDLTVCTALLDLRPIYGCRVLAAELRSALRSELRDDALEAYIQAKFTEREERHKKFGDTPYLVEPHIKEGRGGLRDLQALNWIGKATLDTGTPSSTLGLTPSCTQLGLLTPREIYRTRKIWHFLWTLRVHLHYVTGRAEERLTFDVQPVIGARMGYANHGQQRGVERFMRHYYLMARSIMRLSSIIQPSLLLHQQNLPSFSGPAFQPGPDGFQFLNGRLAVANPTRFENEPLTLFQLLDTARRYRLSLHPTAVQHLIQNERHAARLRDNPEAGSLFLDLLCDRAAPTSSPALSPSFFDERDSSQDSSDGLSSGDQGSENHASDQQNQNHRNDDTFWLPLLNESGLLARFLPDWSRVLGLTQVSGYHIYTVDEHIIESVRVLRQIEAGRLADELPLAYTLARHLQARHALYVATLLHDIGKGRGRDHSQLGAELAVSICTQLGLSPEETDTVSWLVLHHLLLSHTAFTRDIDDPQTILDLADIIQSPERLRLLLLLTIADIRAVGPRGWNAWKATLLHRLYTRLADVLEGGQQTCEDDQRVSDAQAALAHALRADPDSGMTEGQTDRFLRLGTPGYWLGFDMSTHRQHARLVTDYLENVSSSAAATEGFSLKTGAETDTEIADEMPNKAQTVRIDINPMPSRGITEMTVLCPDKPGTFSKIAGALAVCGVSISDARIYTLANGLALDTFWIQDGFGETFEETAHLARLEEALIDALTDKLDLPAALAANAPALSRRLEALQIPPRVLIDNEASAKFTVVEVNGRDRAALLHELTAALKREGLQISSAHVTTYGLRAVDVFYLHDAKGEKIKDAPRIAQLRTTLLDVLTRRPVS